MGLNVVSLNDSLVVASEGGHLPVIKFLIERGANDLNEPLYVAGSNNQLEVVKYLISKGADDIDAAKSYGHREVVEYLNKL